LHFSGPIIPPMTRITAVTAFLFAAAFPSGVFAAAPQEISRDYIQGAMNTLVSVRERFTDTGKGLVRPYLVKELERAGLSVSLHEDSGNINIIGEKKGSLHARRAQEERILVVGAHYDSVEGSSGADDDASGVAAALGVAYALGGMSHPHTLRITLYDNEEKGLWGSKAYVGHLCAAGELDKLAGALIMDVIGYDKNADNAFQIFNCMYDPASPYNGSDLLSARLLETIAAAKLPLRHLPSCIDGGSDHIPYWYAGQRAVLITQNLTGGDGVPEDYNNCINQTCDNIEHVSTSYITLIANAVALGANDLLDRPPPKLEPVFEAPGFMGYIERWL